MDSVELEGNDGAGPLVANVTHPRFIARFPGSDEELWIAHVQVSGNGGIDQDFSSILFVEGAGLVSIFGIASPDGYPLGLAHDIALEQQAFIAFLRDKNARTERAVGPVVQIFSTHLYYNELIVTKAYLSARGSKLDVGVGYHDPLTDAYVTQVIECDSFVRTGEMPVRT